MSNISNTSLPHQLFREMLLLLLALAFASIPFVAAAQAQERVHAAVPLVFHDRTGQTVTAEAVIGTSS